MTAAPLRFGADRRAAAGQLALPVGLMAWIGLLLVLDRDGPVERQLVLGVATAVLLAAVLSVRAATIRVQTLIVVAFAGAIEVLFSPVLGFYLYRFENVPLYVPPAHGLVYLAALTLGDGALLRSHAGRRRPRSSPSGPGGPGGACSSRTVPTPSVRSGSPASWCSWPAVGLGCCSSRRSSSSSTSSCSERRSASGRGSSATRPGSSGSATRHRGSPAATAGSISRR